MGELPPGGSPPANAAEGPLVLPSPAGYRYRAPIPSCRLDTQLAQELEDYLSATVDSLRPANRGEAVFTTRTIIELIDDVGTLTLPSLREYGRSRFPDELKCLVITARAAGPQSLTAMLQFGDSPYCKLIVDADGTSGREIAHGIGQGVADRLRGYRTLHGWIHRAVMLPASTAILFLAVSVWLAFGAGHWLGSGATAASTGAFFAFGGLALSACFLWALELFPYTIFDTNRNSMSQGRVKWFTGTTAGLIFTLIFKALSAFSPWK